MNVAVRHEIVLENLVNRRRRRLSSRSGFSAWDLEFKSNMIPHDLEDFGKGLDAALRSSDINPMDMYPSSAS